MPVSKKRKKAPRERAKGVGVPSFASVLRSAGDGEVMTSHGKTYALPSFWQGVAAFVGVGPFQVIPTAPIELQFDFYELLGRHYDIPAHKSLGEFIYQAERIKEVLQADGAHFDVDDFRKIVWYSAVRSTLLNVATNVSVPLSVAWNRQDLIDEIYTAINEAAKEISEDSEPKHLIFVHLMCDDDALWTIEMTATVIESIAEDLWPSLAAIDLDGSSGYRWIANPSLQLSDMNLTEGDAFFKTFEVT